MYRCLFFASLLACALPSAAQVKLPPNHRVAPPKATQSVGKADSKSISSSDVEPYLWEWFGKAAIEDVMSYLVVSNEAASRKVTVADSDVEKRIDTDIAAMQKAQSKTLQQTVNDLNNQGFPRSRLFLRTKATLLLDKIILADFHPDNFVKVSTILVRVDSADAGALSTAIQKCQNAYEQLAKGGNWDKVFSSVVTDKKLLATKGQLGWRDLSIFPDSTRKEIPSIVDGGLTHPAQTTSGIQIFRIDMHGSEAKGPELESLRNAYLTAERSKFIDEIRKKSQAQILLK